MSDVVTLSLRTGVNDAVDLDGVTADRCAALSAREIASLPVWIGRRQAVLGELFDVRGERSDRVRVEGSLRRVSGLAAGMAGGELLVDGKAGDRAGSAAPGAAKGMTGGEIVIGGSAGDEVAARARRGLVVVGGDAGPHAARAILAGTLIVVGRTGAHAGRGSKRGSIVALGGIDVPATYEYACTYQPPHLRLTFTYLYRRYGLSVPDRVLDGRFRRYCGDAGEIGKGEILVLAD